MPNSAAVKANDTHEHIVNVPQMRMLAQARAATFNAEARTVEVVATTGAQVLRYGWDGNYMEELGMAPENIRMDRLASGKAPVLNSHQQYELEHVIGVIENARLEGSEIIATLRFSQREDVAPYMQDIADGILCNVSIGYQVYRYELVTAGETETPVYRATDWEPFEISVVPVPADAGAGVRSGNTEQTNRCTILGVRSLENKKDEEMPKEAQNPVTEAAPAAAATEDTTAATIAETQNAAQEATQAERARIVEIQRIVRAANLEPKFADEMINKATPLAEARAAVLNKLAEKSDAVATRGANASVGREANDGLGEAIEAAVMQRANPGKDISSLYSKEAIERSKEHRYMRLSELAREAVERSGTSTRGMSQMEIAKHALAQRSMHTTSDFPVILANVANKTLRAAYAEMPQTFRPLVRIGNAADFKEITRAQLGEAPSLLLVTENGEIRRGSVGEARETYRLATYARIVPITRQVIINDDLDALSRLPEAFGRQAANLESDLVWGQITSNPTMVADSTALFHSNHGNLGTTATSALTSSDLSSLNATRARMRNQKGLDGTTRLNLTPTHIIVPTTLETQAEQIVSAINPNTPAGVNPYAGRLQMIVEPRLNDTPTVGNTAWYAAAVGQVDIIELAYLEGEQGPQFETRNGFDVDGVELKVRMDVAAKVLDWRGLQRNNGA
jgi:hypothetical protein